MAATRREERRLTPLRDYPRVREAAAIAVPGGHGEDAVMAVLALAGLGQPFDPARFAEWLAHYTVPRYVRMLA